MIIKRIKRMISPMMILLFSPKSVLPAVKDWNDSDLFSRFKKFAECNKDITYEFSPISIPQYDAKHKWVGAQALDNAIITIPNDAKQVLVKKGEKIENRFELNTGTFKWTGGCIWNNCVYAFPRSANSFLKITDDSVEEIPLSISYVGEHHYSGVCTKEGVVYQPPRNTDHFLKSDLQTGKSEKIPITWNAVKMQLRYCGSIVHPNGYIYFFPEKSSRVIKLDPKTDKWCFIGNRVSSMCFDAKIGLDGNIYGYSAYGSGIMRIDVYNDRVDMIHKEIKPGAYGTKYGINGKLYSIPGDGNSVYQFDVEKDEVREVATLGNTEKAKFAGGITTKNGIIYGAPAAADSIFSLIPNSIRNIPDCLYEAFYIDNY